ncbi:MAG: hypothetical protein FWB71_06070, partial [Defluviitaleaceae bacterium]|nr:hypothetical protein [Defluviitaleaceae bacterium]
TDPPMFSNAAQMTIKPSWQAAGGAPNNCDGCQNTCCHQINCPLIGADGRCIAYGSIYFGYLFCGQYPSNQGQCDLYDCPKWEVKNSDK